MTSPADSASRLDSWKEIAAYLGRTIRTVQRWERTSGLPVHRHHHVTSASVYATRKELDAWWASRQSPAPPDAEMSEPEDVSAFTQPHDLYLSARRAWNLRSPESLRRSLALARCATEQDPQFGLAYAMIALAEVSLASLPCEPPREGMERAREAAHIALSLSPTNADAHAALGGVSILFDWDAVAACESFDRALALDPNCPTAWLWYSIVHMARGDFEEGIRCTKRAEELEPHLAIHKVLSAWLLCLSGKPEQALVALLAALRQNPDIPRAYFYAAWCYDQLGQYEQAVHTMQTSTALADFTTAQAALVYALSRAGRTDEARRQFDALISSGKHTSPYWLAVAHIGVGDYATALTCLERSIEQREWYAVSAPWERVFDPVRHDPRFVALMARARVHDSAAHPSRTEAPPVTA